MACQYNGELMKTVISITHTNRNIDKIIDPC